MTFNHPHHNFFVTTAFLYYQRGSLGAFCFRQRPLHLCLTQLPQARLLEFIHYGEPPFHAVILPQARRAVNEGRPSVGKVAWSEDQATTKSNESPHLPHSEVKVTSSSACCSWRRNRSLVAHSSCSATARPDTSRHVGTAPQGRTAGRNGSGDRRSMPAWGQETTTHQRRSKESVLLIVFITALLNHQGSSDEYSPVQI
jgi:hypothetical protein